MGVAWPDEEYLALLGRVVYAVAALEGQLLFDLPRVPHPPSQLDAAELAGRSTTTLGKELVRLSGHVGDSGWRSYLHRGGEALVEIGPRRNAVMHARPATISGSQRLHRWEPGRAEVRPVTDDHLRELLALIEAHHSAVDGMRPGWSD